MNQYESDIRAVRADTKSGEGGVTLSINHMVQFLAVDSSAEDFDDLAIQAAKGATLKEIVDAEQSVSEMRRLFKIFVPETSPDDASLFEHTTSRGRTGVFTVASQGKRAVYIGLGALAPNEKFDDVSEEGDRPHSGALQSTAEMAFTIGRLY